MTFTITRRASAPHAETVRHDHCAVCGEAYEDNSRTSKACPAHRAEYRRRVRAAWTKRRKEMAK